MKGISQRGNQLSNGMFGIKSLDSKFITSRQIEAARIAATRYMKREGQLWIKIFRQAYYQKAFGSEDGKGKRCPRIFCGGCQRIMFEIAGVPIDIAKEALRLAAQKLPVKQNL